MKNFLFLLLLLSQIAVAQNGVFSAPDLQPNCAILKSGKFASTEYSPEEYYMIVHDGIQTEYVADGRYVRSKMEFVTECDYKTTILEVTIPDYFAKVGDFLTTTITETQREYIKVKSVMFGKAYEFTFVKLSN